MYLSARANLSGPIPLQNFGKEGKNKAVYKKSHEKWVKSG